MAQNNDFSHYSEITYGSCKSCRDGSFGPISDFLVLLRIFIDIGPFRLYFANIISW